MNSPYSNFQLDNRVALVTGAAGLLGKEFCRTLAQAGARVAMADIEADKVSKYASELQSDGHVVAGITVDITKKKSVDSLAEQVLEMFNTVDILVNSAAVDPKFDPSQTSAHSFTFENYPLNQWRQALEVNLTGMFLVTQAISSAMLDRGKGSIINICSTYGLVGPDQRIYPGEGASKQYKPVHYSVTKAGVLGLTRYLASYYSGTEIRVNALTPGGVYNDHDDEFVKAYSARTILGRMARSDEMNGALLYLASDASSYMTGANLVVDGGWTAW